MQIFPVRIVRTAYAEHILNIKASNAEDALRSAKEQAGDLTFSAYAADYEYEVGYEAENAEKAA